MGKGKRSGLFFCDQVGKVENTEKVWEGWRILRFCCFSNFPCRALDKEGRSGNYGKSEKDGIVFFVSLSLPNRRGKLFEF